MGDVGLLFAYSNGLNDYMLRASIDRQSYIPTDRTGNGYTVFLGEMSTYKENVHPMEAGQS